MKNSSIKIQDLFLILKYINKIFNFFTQYKIIKKYF